MPPHKKKGKAQNSRTSNGKEEAMEMNIETEEISILKPVIRQNKKQKKEEMIF